MNIYRAEEVTTIIEGQLLLNKEQARRRSHLMMPTKNKIEFANHTERKEFTIKRGPIYFKVGEIFGHDEDLSKVPTVSICENGEENNSMETFPIKKAMGWYELSDGKNIRGEEEALDAQMILDENNKTK